MGWTKINVFLAVALGGVLLSGCGDAGTAEVPASSGKTGAEPMSVLVEAFGSGATPLVRVDFADDSAWQKVIDEVIRPVNLEDPEAEPTEDDYQPHVEQVADRHFDGLAPADIAAEWDRAQDVAGYALIADARSMAEAAAGGEITVVYLDLTPTPELEAEFGWKYGRSFRTLTSEIASIEANLSISNMDFDEFADGVDPHDAVFRGFAEE
ncbi:hypothetical protein EFK50_07355 [Nocardioides marmoriginsengisoli]|uniref:DUF6924 domain-containing protein n=1 Tax=Nocardioides marmoriginsengisoli TaxID=661483 RepID=A0A3N0CMQ1_9ACTN|nr:hypothetical protein [Nocardioides marmoriginsengisoli]RNL64336.1 hypothetical protein EFK50_07355 [Nocardioides marmoriginsengisoli]